MTRPTSMLAPSPELLAQVDRDLDAIFSGQAGVTLHQFLRDRAREQIGLASATLSPRFQLAEELVLLQALSHGQVDSDKLNPRLSLFLFSNSGTGKTKIGEMARMLAPVSDQVQPSLVTVPGLAATVTRKEGQWSAKPGVLPDCSGGVLQYDDVHRTEPRIINQIQAVLMSIAEEGRINLLKAGAQHYDGKVALVLTTNALSMRDGRVGLQVEESDEHSESQRRAKDIGMPWDMASRIDLMLNLSTDDNAILSAMEIAAQKAHGGSGADETYPSDLSACGMSPQKRYLKLLVARIVERIPVVDLTPVAERLRLCVAKLGIVLREQAARLRGKNEENFDGAGLIRRMGNSLKKLVGALARLSCRSVAIGADVDRAVELLIPKVEVVRYICKASDRVRPMGSLDEMLELALISSEDRWEETVAAFGGQRVTADQIGERLCYGERVMRRELQKRGVSAEDGYYLIPTEYRRPYGRPNLSDLSRELDNLPPEQDVGSGLRQVRKEEEHQFDDCLVKVPEHLQEAVEVARDLTGDEKSSLEINLSKLAAHENPRFYPISAQGVVTALRDYNPDLGPVGRELLEWLAAPEFRDRRIRAVSFWVEARGLWEAGGQFWMLHEHYGPPPDGDDAIAAYRARFQWRMRQDILECEAKNPPEAPPAADPFLDSLARVMDGAPATPLSRA